MAAVSWTKHAIEQMHKRGITTDEVVDVICNPERCENNESGTDRRRYVSGPVAVVVEQTSDQLTIITVMHDDNRK